MLLMFRDVVVWVVYRVVVVSGVDRVFRLWVVVMVVIELLVKFGYWMVVLIVLFWLVVRVMFCMVMELFLLVDFF